MKRNLRIRQNLEAHGKRMQELIDQGMSVEKASKQALKDILAQPKPKEVYYACSCTNCGWQGSRTLKGMKKSCPKCKMFRVFPNNPRVTEL